MRWFSGLMLASLSVCAFAADFEPVAWLRQTYALYHRAEKDSALLKESAPDLIAPFASPALAALFKREADCVKKSQGICALDWDFIVNGQDWELGPVKVGPLQASGDKATVTVDFSNMKTPNTVVYYLVRIGGTWKIDDIEDRRKGDKPVRIGNVLREFKAD